MNLRVDLILESERRSGSRVSLALVGRVAAVAVPALAALWVVSMIVQYQRVQGELRHAERTWSRMQAEYDAAVALRTNLVERRALLSEIEGWRRARVDWHAQFEALRRGVPDQVQITDLRMDSLIQAASNRTVRQAKLQLSGKTGGPEADAHVAGLLSELQQNPVFTNVIRSAEVPRGSFSQDPAPTATKQDRVFLIVCDFGTREFE